MLLVLYIAGLIPFQNPASSIGSAHGAPSSRRRQMGLFVGNVLSDVEAVIDLFINFRTCELSPDGQKIEAWPTSHGATSSDGSGSISCRACRSRAFMHSYPDTASITSTLKCLKLLRVASSSPAGAPDEMGTASRPWHLHDLRGRFTSYSSSRTAARRAARVPRHRRQRSNALRRDHRRGADRPTWRSAAVRSNQRGGRAQRTGRLLPGHLRFETSARRFFRLRAEDTCPGRHFPALWLARAPRRPRPRRAPLGTIFGKNRGFL